MAINNNDFQKDLEIDALTLDIELLEQPQKYFKYSEELSEANRELDRLKLKYEIMQAKLDIKIRTKLTQEGVKATENLIRSTVVQETEFSTISNELSDQKKEVDILSSGVKAFEQRKSSIENLVKLQAQNYFAAPREPRDLEAITKVRKEQIRSQLAQVSLNRNKKEN